MIVHFTITFLIYIFMLIVVFWFCFFIVFYTYLGYGIIIYFLSKYSPFNKDQILPNLADVDLPSLTLCIAAYNEANVISMKMENSLSLRYPKDKLKIVWVIDGSTDESSELLKEYNDVQVLYRAPRLGKTAALNHAMEVIDTEVVVFTDANCLLSNESLYLIGCQFEDPTIGCVSGEKRVEFYDKDGTASKGEGVYWLYESMLKKWDSNYYSAVGAAGELFAIRTSFFKPVSTDVLLDDFMISMRIAEAGHRIAYLPEAYAVERGSLNIEEEKKRKVRIAAGGWQSVWLLKSLFNIFKYGRLSFQYISHRVLRWTITPFALFLLFPINILLVLFSAQQGSVYSLILVFQILFYMLSFVGYLKRDKEHVSKVFFVPFYFVFMNINVIEGLNYLTSKSKSGVWEKSKRKA